MIFDLDAHPRQFVPDDIRLFEVSAVSSATPRVDQISYLDLVHCCPQRIMSNIFLLGSFENTQQRTRSLEFALKLNLMRAARGRSNFADQGMEARQHTWSVQVIAKHLHYLIVGKRLRRGYIIDPAVPLIQIVLLSKSAFVVQSMGWR